MTTDPADKPSFLGPGTRVQLGVAVLAAVAVWGFLTRQQDKFDTAAELAGSHWESVTKDLRTLSDKVRDVHEEVHDLKVEEQARTDDLWKRRDMREFVLKLARDNPSLKVDVP